MLLRDLVTPDSRVLDVGAPDAGVAGALREAGVSRYLGLMEPGAVGAARAAAPELADRLHPLESPEQALRASADVVILRAPYARVGWLLKELRYAAYVLVEVPRGVSTLEGAALRTAGALTRAVRARGRVTVGGLELDVLQIRRRRPERTRRYLSPVLGVTGFVQRLAEDDVSYAVLRWFEDLPEIEPGEDLDMLVADRDLETVRALLAEEPGTIAVDLYSETGLPGSDYNTAAYYPPALARALLARAVVHSSGARVPESRDHLRSLGYHAAYHKGPLSGLPSTTTGQQLPDPEHDYRTALHKLALDHGLQPPGTLEELDELLAAEGWRPPLDALLRLTATNPWIEPRFFPHDDIADGRPEPVVFLLRERLATVVGEDEFLKTIDHLGFEAVAVRALDEESRQRVAGETRGGNWGPGPFPVSGGGPVTAVVALHHAPQAPRGPLLRQYPRLTNADVLLAKQRVRDLVAERVAPEQTFNPVHSSDNEREAWEYLRIALPDELDALRAEVLRRTDNYDAEEHAVVSRLSRGRRAKVEVVDTPQGRVVRKTFAAGYLRHMQRELDALSALGGVVPAVPELVGSGPNWIATPYYQDELAPYWRSRRLLPLPVVRQMVDVLRQVHALGYDLVDAKPQNFVLDPEQGLKIVDFEFLHRYDAEPPPFRESYGLVGTPIGFAGDMPVGDDSYGYRWRRWTGLTLAALTGGSPRQQQVDRVRYRMLRVVRRSEAGARKATRETRRAARRSRGVAGRPRLPVRRRSWARRRALGTCVRPDTHRERWASLRPEMPQAAALCTYG